MSTSNSPMKRPVGRPRADGKAQLTRDALLNATAKLIARNGYTGTSIRMIAAELDVTTASIFNHYPSKELLLNALIAHGVKPFLEFYDRLNALDLPPAVGLYKSITEETLAVSAIDRDHISLFNQPELLRPEFTEIQAVRNEMVTHYRKLIAAGEAAGTFVVADTAWTAEQVFQLAETSARAAGTSVNLSPQKRSAITADFCLRGLLVDPGELEKIRKASDKVELRIELN